MQPLHFIMLLSIFETVFFSFTLANSTHAKTKNKGKQNNKRLSEQQRQVSENQ